jgi:hypothetical protein
MRVRVKHGKQRQEAELSAEISHDAFLAYLAAVSRLSASRFRRHRE